MGDRGQRHHRLVERDADEGGDPHFALRLDPQDLQRPGIDDRCCDIRPGGERLIDGPAGAGRGKRLGRPVEGGRTRIGAVPGRQPLDDRADLRLVELVAVGSTHRRRNLAVALVALAQANSQRTVPPRSGPAGSRGRGNLRSHRSRNLRRLGRHNLRRPRRHNLRRPRRHDLRGLRRHNLGRLRRHNLRGLGRHNLRGPRRHNLRRLGRGRSRSHWSGIPRGRRCGRVGGAATVAGTLPATRAGAGQQRDDQAGDHPMPQEPPHESSPSPGVACLDLGRLKCPCGSRACRAIIRGRRSCCLGVGPGSHRNGRAGGARRNDGARRGSLE